MQYEYLDTSHARIVKVEGLTRHEPVHQLLHTVYIWLALCQDYFLHHGMEFNFIREHKQHNRTSPYILSALRLSLCPIKTSDNDLDDGL